MVPMSPAARQRWAALGTLAVVTAFYAWVLLRLLGGRPATFDWEAVAVLAVVGAVATLDYGLLSIARGRADKSPNSRAHEPDRQGRPPTDQTDAAERRRQPPP